MMLPTRAAPPAPRHAAGIPVKRWRGALCLKGKRMLFRLFVFIPHLSGLGSLDFNSAVLRRRATQPVSLGPAPLN